MDQKDALHKPIKRVSKQRSDGQKSGLAGEFFVAAELLRRGLQTSLTLGNAKSIDIFAINDRGTRFTIQVKALRSPNYFPINLEHVQDAFYYVFVVLKSRTLRLIITSCRAAIFAPILRSLGSGLRTIKRCPALTRKTSQSIATIGKFLSRNRI